MKLRRIFRLDPSLKTEWPNYMVRSAAAAATLFFIILVLQFQGAVIGASLGASTFIVFAMPRSITARPRHIVGGHLLGLISGTAFSLIPAAHPVFQAAIMALSVGCTLLLMVSTDTEHPPAAGTALGIALDGVNATEFLSFIVSIVLLAAIHRLFGHRLRDLV